ncbi:MAG TPA: hypothetical protein VMR50_03945 [Myxococcota bacterium]|nr:hypothetical protein [Myxococcota bacterium]
MTKYVLVLLVLVAGAAGGLYWNYQRNAAMVADLSKPRPYAKFSTADVTKLIAAYQGEIKRKKARVAAAPGGQDAISQKGESDVGGKAEAFENFQHENERWKAQRGAVIEEEVELQALLFEKSIRDRHLDDPDYVFKARLLTY